MRKKMLTTLVTVAMIASLLAGCGAPEEGAVTKDKPDTDTKEEGDQAIEKDPTDLAEITISYWPLAALPEEAQLVADAINEITEAEIGVTVNLNILDSGAYIPNGAMANGVANNEDFDLVLTAPALSGHFAPMLNNGMLLPIEGLLEEYGKELKDTVPAEFLDATTKEGSTYAVPVYGNKVKNIYWVCRKSVAEGAGIDVASVKTMQDLEAALVKIKETFPDMTPIAGNSRSLGLTYPGYGIASGSTYQQYDNLGESTAVAAMVDFEDTTLEVVSRYESDVFKADADLVKKWYDMGLVDKDTATDTATSNTLEEKENAASNLYCGQFNMLESLVKSDEIESVKIADGSVGTGALLQFTWAIPVSCDEPEAAMKFMNMMFTDERIVNLIDFGVEGVHYEKKADGTIGFIEGMTAETSGYYMGGITELVGNSYLSHTWEGGNPTKNTRAKEEMDQAKYSPLLGFSLDTSSVGDIYAQLCSIANEEYGPAIFSGSAPEGYLEEMIEKLKAAGLQDYLDEANKQLKEWIATKK